MNQIGLLLTIAGVVLIIFGLIIMGGPGPLGRLPGDIKIERPNFTFYFPLATSIIISIVLTVLFWAAQKFWR